MATDPSLVLADVRLEYSELRDLDGAVEVLTSAGDFGSAEAVPLLRDLGPVVARRAQRVC